MRSVLALTICPGPIWHDWECWSRNWHFFSYIKTSFYFVNDWLTSVRVNVDLCTFKEVCVVFSNYNQVEVIFGTNQLFGSYLALINCSDRIWHNLNCWSWNWHFPPQLPWHLSFHITQTTKIQTDSNIAKFTNVIGFFLQNITFYFRKFCHIQIDGLLSTYIYFVDLT